MTIRALLHLLLHVALPGAVARAFFRPRWRRAWVVMLLTMAVDLDHLLVRPIYDPGRCSIGFHPLHTYPMVAVYLALTVPRPTRLVGLGLLLHMGLDALDCLLMR